MTGMVREIKGKAFLFPWASRLSVFLFLFKFHEERLVAVDWCKLRPEFFPAGPRWLLEGRQQSIGNNTKLNFVKTLQQQSTFHLYRKIVRLRTTIISLKLCPLRVVLTNFLDVVSKGGKNRKKIFDAFWYFSYFNSLVMEISIVDNLALLNSNFLAPPPFQRCGMFREMVLRIIFAWG